MKSYLGLSWVLVAAVCSVSLACKKEEAPPPAASAAPTTPPPATVAPEPKPELTASASAAAPADSAAAAPSASAATSAAAAPSGSAAPVASAAPSSSAATDDAKKVAPGGNLTPCCNAIAAAAKKGGKTANQYSSAAMTCEALAKSVKSGKAVFSAAKVTVRAQLHGVPVPAGC